MQKRRSWRFCILNKLMKKIHIVFRSLLAISSLAVIAGYYLPLWEIGLIAPQYPEGLSIYIWHNNITGDIDIINGLNHYIGMKHIKVEMFPEFSYIRYIIAGMIALGLFVSIMGNKIWLKIYCVVILICGITALADFYRWGYDYGHNLDTTAPIQIVGMAYQPPIIGYKELLNFTALSLPASGGWIFVCVALIAFTALFFEWFNDRKIKKNLLLLIPAFFFLGSCGDGKPQFNFGKDNCEYCKMTMMNNKFGVAIETDKGRVYKFDDIICMKNYLNAEKPKIVKNFVVLYDKPGQIEEASNIVYGKFDGIKSPMSTGIGFFSSKESFHKIFDSTGSTGKFQDLINDL